MDTITGLGLNIKFLINYCFFQHILLVLIVGLIVFLLFLLYICFQDLNKYHFCAIVTELPSSPQKNLKNLLLFSK
jgi:hypothetical protein